MLRVGVQLEGLPSSNLPRDSGRCKGEVEGEAIDIGGETWLGEVSVPGEKEDEVLGGVLAGVAGHVAQLHVRHACSQCGLHPSHH